MTKYENDIASQLRKLLQRIGVQNGVLGLIGEDNLSRSSAKLAEFGYETRPIRVDEEQFADSGNACQAVVICDLARIKGMPENLNALNSFCETNRVPLLAVTLNAGYEENAYRLFGYNSDNDWLDPALPGYARYTGRGLEKVMSQYGFIQFAQADIAVGTNACPDENYGFLSFPNTPARQYLDWLKGQTDKYSKVFVFVRAYLPAVVSDSSCREVPNEDREVFLTVLVCAEEKRLDCLEDILLCLMSQTDDDFEVVIIGHKEDKEAKDALPRLLDDIPTSLRRRVRYIACGNKNRSESLNCGFSIANGMYVSVLDDDVLVLDHWVETFKSVYGKGPGTVLHVFGVTQEWEKDLSSGALSAVGVIEEEYCEPFDYVRQLFENRCPPSCLAFPKAVFDDCGKRFDETLAAAEDWDYLMHSVNIAGITEISEITSVNRRWRNADNQPTPHRMVMRKSDYETIKERMNSRPVLLPIDWVDLLERYYRLATDSVNLQGKSFGKSRDFMPVAALYYCGRDAFSADKIVHSENAAAYPDFDYTYDLPARQIRRIRFDPAENGEISILHLEITLVSDSGQKHKMAPSFISGNGHQVQGYYCFLTDDPQLICKVPSGFTAAKVIVRGTYILRPPRHIRQKLWTVLETPPAVSPSVLLRHIWRRART